MKKVLFLCIMCTLLVAAPASAYDFMVDGLCYNKNADGTSVTVTSSYLSYTNLSRTITIPDSVTYSGKTYSVTFIGSSAFRSCSGLTSVTIGNSVTSIGDHAFYQCTSLTSVTIPNSVTLIGGEAFEGCSGLTSVTIGNSVTSIASSIFSGCISLTNVTIGSSVTSIGSGVFSDCSSLASIKVESGNPTYDSRENCNAIIATATNTLIAGCKNTIIPKSVSSIGSLAYYKCSWLTSLTIPNSVTSIGHEAFRGCSGLTSVTIPNSVTSIGYAAFEGTAWYDSHPNGLVYAGLVAYKYKGTMPSGTSMSLKSDTKGIAGSCFDGCSGLTSVTIPNSVTSIGRFAFNGCSKLTSVTIGNSVTSIGDCAFYQCTSLTSVTIPNSVTTIGYDAFRSCIGLTSVTFPSSVTNFGNNVFLNCSSIETITLTGKGRSTLYNWMIASRAPYIKILNIGSEINSLSGLKMAPTTINCYAEVPPACVDNTFTNYEGALHVPTASTAAYFTANYWRDFENLNNDLTEKVVLSHSTASLDPGGKLRLTATTTPDGAAVEWCSTNSAVATVSDGGLVTAVAGGECDIFATLAGQPAVYASCHISTSYPDITLSLDKQSLGLLAGEQDTLKAVIIPDNTGLTPTWATSKASVARVSKGVVTAVAEGECDITATVLDKKATCHVTVRYPEITLALNKQRITLSPGDESTLKAVITPDNMGLIPTWTSSNASVATVSNGVVTAVAEGECDITATMFDKQATCHVVVRYPDITVALDKQDIHLAIGDTSTLSATIKPAISGLTPTWTTSNASVATVSNGVVTGVGVGECDITVTVRDVSASCHVAVDNMVLWFDRSKAYIGVNTLLTLLPAASPDVEMDFVATSSDPSVALVRIVNRSNAPAYCLLPDDLPLASFAPAPALAPALAGQKAVQVVGLAAGKTTVTLSSADGDVLPATCEVTVVDISTVNRVINVVLSLSDITPDDDIDGSGVVDIGDINALINIILGI